MNNKGFTLVELLAVIVILGILMTIAIPSVLKVSSGVKDEAYDTKITNFKAAVVEYGETIKSKVKSSTNYCHFTYENEEVKTITVTTTVPSSNDETTFPCVETTLNYLASENYINYDSDTSVINPINKKVINSCKIYVYYRYGYLYGAFDKDACDNLVK